MLRAKGFTEFRKSFESLTNINNWFSEHPDITIVKTMQSIDDIYVYITIFYEETE